MLRARALAAKFLDSVPARTERDGVQWVAAKPSFGRFCCTAGLISQFKKSWASARLGEFLRTTAHWRISG